MFMGWVPSHQFVPRSRRSAAKLENDRNERGYIWSNLVLTLIDLMMDLALGSLLSSWHLCIAESRSDSENCRVGWITSPRLAFHKWPSDNSHAIPVLGSRLQNV